jgi:hypothetical protein
MATINDFGDLSDALSHPPLGGPNGWAAAVRDAITANQVRVTHPNGTDVHVQAWDAGLARWQTVHYDSGWRDLGAGSLLNGWTASVTPRLRRIDGIVHLEGTVVGAAKTDYRALNIPAGFRPIGTGGGALFRTGSTTAIPWDRASSGNVRIFQTDVVTGGILLDGSWSTSDAIPTSLPGTAVGTVLE